MAIDNVMRNILDAAREYGFFVDRGDPVNVDWAVGDFIKDNAWRELDLSSIVPEHAHGVLFTAHIRATAVDKYFNLRENGNANVRNTSFIRTQVANIRIAVDLSCPCSAARKVDYRVVDATVNFLNVTVKGWWF